ncbi:MAG TPA: hypothetical protein VN999_06860 [Thermoanaerobaculia bacterium]|nr:hypothetical protein [Thermoanaerobaculia bacterium]
MSEERKEDPQDLKEDPKAAYEKPLVRKHEKLVDVTMVTLPTVTITP